MPTRLTIKDILASKKNPFEGVKVAILGDAMVDRYIYGEVERISPEAPIPVVRVTKRTTHIGGAGNVASNLISLGAIPLLVGIIGDDELGKSFCEISKKENITSDFIVKTTETPTTSKTRIIARRQQVVRFDEEELTDFSPDVQQQIMKKLKEVRKEAKVLIISDYAKGAISQEVLDYAKELWKNNPENNVAIIADPKPRKGVSYSGLTGMTPNIKEAKDILGEEIFERSNENAEMFASRLLNDLNLEYILFTRDACGMSLLEKGKKIVHIPTRAREVAEVSGAGDTVISVFAGAIAGGLNLESSSQLANLAGGIVVEKLGTASASWEELYKELDRI